MKKLLLLALVGAILLNAVPALADDGFYVVAVRGTPGTEITRLPSTITAAGYYYLTRNLSYSGGNGITVNADNVTIDLMGLTLSGPGTTNNYVGISIFGSNVEVRNGTVSGWNTGISSGGGGSRAIGVRAVENAYGIILSNDALIKGCTASPGSTTMGYGLGVISGAISGCTVMDFSPIDSTLGQILIDLGTGGRASGNLVLNCNSTGIKSGSVSAAITDNVVINCKNGIDMGGGGSLVANSVYATPGQTALLFYNTPVVADQNAFFLVNGATFSNGTWLGTWGLNDGGPPPTP
jgi:hypothetical protein